MMSVVWIHDVEPSIAAARGAIELEKPTASVPQRRLVRLVLPVNRLLAVL